MRSALTQDFLFFFGIAVEDDPRRRKRLERRFDRERGDSRRRVLQLQRDHELALAIRMAKMGVLR